jgi:hypothetical protein
MKRLFLVGLLSLVTVITTLPAQGGIMYQDPWIDPSGPSSGGEPTTTACTAIGASGQKCRECAYTHKLDGSVLSECKLRTRSASCSCWMATGCENRGTCTYK